VIRDHRLLCVDVDGANQLAVGQPPPLGSFRSRTPLLTRMACLPETVQVGSRFGATTTRR
jgi:hypothetical protein